MALPLLYRGSTIYPQKAELFRLSRFYSQVILRASFEGFGYSFAFLAFLLFSLFFKAFSILICKKKKTPQNGFLRPTRSCVLVILFIPQAKDFCPLRIIIFALGYGEFDLARILYRILYLWCKAHFCVLLLSLPKEYPNPKQVKPKLINSFGQCFPNHILSYPLSPDLEKAHSFYISIPFP